MKLKSAANLHETPLIRFLAHHSAAFLRDAYSPGGATRLRPGTAAEQYIQSCLVSAGELMTACDQLSYALIYLSGYRRRRTADGSLITRSDHLAYQIENFVIRLGTITDRALKLVNTAFQLGIPPRECRRSVVAENTHVARTPVRKRLSELDAAINPHRAIRNRVVHGQRYSDSELNEIEGFFVLEKSSGVQSDPIINRYRILYKARTDAYVKTKKSEFLALANSVSNLVGLLLDSLLPVVERTHQGLSVATTQER
jgi:hypothetical protein